MKQVTTFPEWFARMALDATLDAKEVVTLFRYASVDSLHRQVSDGHFPKADKEKPRRSRYGTTRKVCWSKKLILQEIQRRKEIADATSRD